MGIIEYNETFRKSLKETLVKQLGHGYLVANRQLTGSFYHTFADALYEYEKGVILLERFYIESKAEPLDVYYKKLDKDSIDKAKRIKQELRSVLSDHIADNGNMMERQAKIDELTKESEGIKVEAVKMQVYKYKNIPLAKFDLYDEESLDSLADLFTAFAINSALFMAMRPLSDYEIMVSTIKSDDYVDLILVPSIKRE